MTFKYFALVACAAFVLISSKISAQINSRDIKNEVYVDQKGIIRFTKTNQEAAFFGVNYTAPFAYGYRANKVLGIDPEKSIEQDVYHLSRIGVDAFRLHLWETEFTDTLGNLLQNEHLKLLDYLLWQLKKRNIKVIITAIAFNPNGYPERDEKTPGFAGIYRKGEEATNPKAIKAEETYVKQLIVHINPYTNQSYKDDPNIIAAEINNEPSHSGPKVNATAYINKLCDAMKEVGWTKPLFYNISQGPYYAEAVAKSEVNGFSFQWYPSGLVSGRWLKYNFLPNVDRYTIPYDTIPAYLNKARMVYEFDAGDVLGSFMYPAMARSFKTAGFQWATQFAYDPMATAYANTEYQTHYLNLAYTPSKAISFLIASKVFHKLPREKSYGTYPADSTFDAFTVSYRRQLSLMNTDQEFYYTNNVEVAPLQAAKLDHIAGIGSSPIVGYKGYGAYFLDKLENGTWRLEVMPDAISIRDPFERPSLKKEVTRIQWEPEAMHIALADLGDDFIAKPLNAGNSYIPLVSGKDLTVQPGVYLLTRKEIKNTKWTADSNWGVITLGEYAAPKPFDTTPFVVHKAFASVTAGVPFILKAKVVGVNSNDKVMLMIHNSAGGRYQTINMAAKLVYDYEAVIGADLLNAGLLSYKIVVQSGADNFTAFPGNHPGNPSNWDNYNNDEYETPVTPATAPLVLFNANTGRNEIDGSPFGTGFITTETAGQMAVSMKSRTGRGPMIRQLGFHVYLGEKIAGVRSTLQAFNKLVVVAKTEEPGPIKVKISLIDDEGGAYSAVINVNNNFGEIEIPLSSLQKDSYMLLPHAYPDFVPQTFKSNNDQPFNIHHLNILEVVTVPGENDPQTKTYSLDVEQVLLKK